MTAYTAGHVFEFRASSRCNLIGRFAGNGKNVDRLLEGGQPLAQLFAGRLLLLDGASLVRRRVKLRSFLQMAGPAMDQGGLLLRRQLMG